MRGKCCTEEYMKDDDRRNGTASGLYCKILIRRVGSYKRCWAHACSVYGVELSYL